jgi:ABC-type Fe3+/spermidine/putrescine transport system ATPase subunit
MTDLREAKDGSSQGDVGGASILSIKGLKKSYGDRRSTTSVAVRALDLEIAEHEVVALLGPSGCGKTTVLRCVAGLLVPDAGEISIGGKLVNSTGRPPARPEQRNIAMVFQQYALWPHLTVEENVAFGLKARKAPKALVAERTDEALKRVRLGNMKDRRISQLSGGQQQRIALARALAVQPTLILFDEPLSNLDAGMREEMRYEILELQQSIGFAALYVTHDHSEAMGLANRIVMMRDGQVEQAGSPRALWERPSSRFVVDFFGQQNRIPGVVDAVAADGTVTLRCADGMTVAGHDHSGRTAVGDSVLAYVHQSDVVVTAGEPAPGEYEGTVTLRSFEGHSVVIRVQVAGVSLMVRTPPSSRYRVGDRVGIRLNVDSVQVFSADA